MVANVSRNTTATPVTAPKLHMMDHFVLKVNALRRRLEEYGKTTESNLQLFLIKQVNPV